MTNPTIATGMAVLEAHAYPTSGDAQLEDASPNLSPHSSDSIKRDATGARIIVVMGVCGTGKSTLGEALGGVLHLPFIDGDDLHPAENVAKMSRGEPLDDGDRQPWLERIRRTAVERVMAQMGEQRRAPGRLGGDETGTGWRPGVVVACSALKKTYRAMLRGTEDGASLPTYFVYLEGERDVLMARMQSRQGHYMKAGMLESQLDTLESPEGEPGVVSVSVDLSTEAQVQSVIQSLS